MRRFFGVTGSMRLGGCAVIFWVFFWGNSSVGTLKFSNVAFTFLLCGDGII